MPNNRTHVQYPELKGSEMHHELKNRPGDKGDPKHANADESTIGEGTGKAKDDR